MKTDRKISAFALSIIKKLPLRAYLCVLLVITAALGSITYSSYVTEFSGKDQARVAKFEITESGVYEGMITAQLSPGESDTATLVIHNKSEVAVEYTVTVTNVHGNLPLVFAVDGNGASEGEYTYSDVLAPGSTEKSYVLEIIWPLEENSYLFSGKVDSIKISVDVSQKG